MNIQNAIKLLREERQLSPQAISEIIHCSADLIQRLGTGSHAIGTRTDGKEYTPEQVERATSLTIALAEGVCGTDAAGCPQGYGSVSGAAL